MNFEEYVRGCGATTFAGGKMLSAQDDAIGLLVFNQPEKHNAISVEMWEAVEEIIAGHNANPAVRVIVMGGAGNKAFVSGSDISQFAASRNSADADAEFQRRIAGGKLALSESQKPTIALINGWCLGGGLAVAMAADLRIASANSAFGVPAAKLGIAYSEPDVKRLVRLVGQARARMMLYTASRIDADEAARYGLIDQIAANDELTSVVMTLAKSIAANAPLSVMAAKLTIDELIKDAADRDQDLIAMQTTICMNSQDYAEGRRAFSEKRAPIFVGA